MTSGKFWLWWTNGRRNYPKYDDWFLWALLYGFAGVALVGIIGGLLFR
jgi:hypothetical protein